MDFQSQGEEEEEVDYSDIELEEGDAAMEDAVDAEDMTLLDQYIQSYDWPAVLRRIKSHPHECRTVNRTEGRTPLHVACDHDAPAVVIQTLCQVYPEASIRTGTSNMNPLHITCSSPSASLHVVRVLIELGWSEQFSMRDVDGDTPLHAACRCGAPLPVLEWLGRAHPAAVHVRDYEGLTPLLRLWVRHFVIWGEDAFFTDWPPQGELWDAWQKTEWLLRLAHYGVGDSVVDPAPPAAFCTSNLQAVLSRVHSVSSLWQQQNASSAASMISTTRRTLHAAAAVDVPRVVLRIAARMYPEQLLERDEQGRTPLMVAAAAPTFPFHNLSDDGYTQPEEEEEEEVAHPLDDNEINREEAASNKNTTTSPSVLELLLEAHPHEPGHGGADRWDPSGRLPLHIALEAGKRWDDGIGALVAAYPESVTLADRSTKLYPYQLAATKDNLHNTYALLRLNPTLLMMSSSSPRNVASLTTVKK